MGLHSTLNILIWLVYGDSYRTLENARCFLHTEEKQYLLRGPSCSELVKGM